MNIQRQLITRYSINRCIMQRLMGTYPLMKLSLFFILVSVLDSCSDTPYYTRFVDLDSKCWSRMATVEFFPLEEDSTFFAPLFPVSAILTLRHTSGHHYIIPLELCHSFNGGNERTDTIYMEIGNSRHIRKDGGYGLEITQIPLLRNERISDDFRISVSPLDSVEGLHSIGITILTSPELP